MQKNLNYTNFIIAAVITSIVALSLFYSSYSIGKNEFFLLLNNNLGAVGDIFFTIITFLGDGAVWAVLLFVFIKYNKQNIPLLIAAFVICTLLVQVCKYVIIPDAFRPIKAIEATHLIHIVKGMEPHETASFPSGHTSAAFSFFLIGCLLVHQKWIVPVGFIYAILVGYSRVYLAQHFPFDVAAGMLVGVITISLAILIQLWWNKRKLKE